MMSRGRVSRCCIVFGKRTGFKVHHLLRLETEVGLIFVSHQDSLYIPVCMDGAAEDSPSGYACVLLFGFVSCRLDVGRNEVLDSDSLVFMNCDLYSKFYLEI